jgi:hypothetical protein
MTWWRRKDNGEVQEWQQSATEEFARIAAIVTQLTARTMVLEATVYGLLRTLPGEPQEGVRELIRKTIVNMSEIPIPSHILPKNHQVFRNELSQYMQVLIQSLERSQSN